MLRSDGMIKRVVSQITPDFSPTAAQTRTIRPFACAGRHFSIGSSVIGGLLSGEINKVTGHKYLRLSAIDGYCTGIEPEV